MTIDRIEYHWDSVEGLFEDDDTQWEIAGAHIGYYIEWAYKKGFTPMEEDNENEGALEVVIGDVSGIEYLIEYCDTKFLDSDLSPEGLAFTTFVYDTYLTDYEKIIGCKPFTQLYNPQHLEKVSLYLDKAYTQYLKKPVYQEEEKTVEILSILMWLKGLFK